MLHNDTINKQAKIHKYKIISDYITLNLKYKKLYNKCKNNVIRRPYLIYKVHIIQCSILYFTFLFGLRLFGGICRVTLNFVCLPISSARKLASCTSAFAFKMSVFSWPRLLLNISSRSCAHFSTRICVVGVQAGNFPLWLPRRGSYGT